VKCGNNKKKLEKALSQTITLLSHHHQKKPIKNMHIILYLFSNACGIVYIHVHIQTRKCNFVVA
jgi:hypothetical protein